MRLTMNAFLPGGRVLLVVEPEADEQVAAEADALPARRRARPGCRPGPARAWRSRTGSGTRRSGGSRVLRHVLGRVQVDEEADAGDDQHHRRAHRVDAEGHVDGHDAAARAPLMLNQRHAVHARRPPPRAAVLRPIAEAEEGERGWRRRRRRWPRGPSAGRPLPSRLPKTPLTKAPSAAAAPGPREEREVVRRGTDDF